MKSDFPQPKLCMNCKHSKPQPRQSWNNDCFHVKVVMSNAWALGNNNEGRPCGVNCSDARKKRFFAPCGIKGKLYEEKRIP